MRNTLFAISLAIALAGSALTACSGDIGKLPFETDESGGSAGSTGSAGSPDDPIEDPKFSPASGGIRRLLGRQYKNTIQLVLGDAAGKVAEPPEDVTLNEFETLAAAELAAPPNAIEQYETSAKAIVEAVIADSAAMAKIVPCVPLGQDDAECYKQVVEGVGHQLWRRPLTAEEVAPIVTIAQAAGNEYKSFNKGVAYSLLVLLQSPYFLYTVEVGVPDPEHPGWFKLTGPELATRMSLFLIDRAPDAALLEAAEKGELETEPQIRAAARELMKQQAAHDALSSFYDVVFKLRDLPTTTKLADVFPEFNAEVGRSMRQESLLFFEDLVWNQNGDYRDVFNADYAFVDDKLAPLYGVKAPAAGAFQKMTLPKEQGRSGFLGHASYLARYSHAGDTSPTRRGVFISTSLLCTEIPPPPPNVDTTFPPFDPDKPMTKKEFLEEIHHKVGTNCGNCHNLMDAYGYAMEKYDAIGRYRTKDEHGLALDTSGEVMDFGAFANAKELGQLMHDDPRTMSCIVTNLFQQSMGHRQTKGERPAIGAIETAFEASGYKLQEAIVEIVASPAFAYVGDPK